MGEDALANPAPFLGLPCSALSCPEMPPSNHPPATLSHSCAARCTLPCAGQCWIGSMCATVWVGVKQPKQPHPHTPFALCCIATPSGMAVSMLPPSSSHCSPNTMATEKWALKTLRSELKYSQSEDAADPESRGSPPAKSRPKASWSKEQLRHLD